MQLIKSNSIIILSFLSILSLCSCAKKTLSPDQTLGFRGPQHPGISQDRSTPGMWSIRSISSCDTVDREHCIGGYEFTLYENGKFRIGPGPNQQSIEGSTHSALFTELTQTLLLFSQDLKPYSIELSCAAPISNINEDHVSIESFGDSNSAELFRSSYLEFCHPKNISIASSKRLFQIIKSIVNENYTSPVPENSIAQCDQSLRELNRLYDFSRQCTTDIECVFIDGNLNPISREELTFLATNDCSQTQPLLVGNSNTILSQKQNILFSFNTTTERCRRTHIVPNCNGFSAFIPTLPAPQCVNGICIKHL